MSRTRRSSPLFGAHTNFFPRNDPRRGAILFERTTPALSLYRSFSSHPRPLLMASVAFDESTLSNATTPQFESDGNGNDFATILLENSISEPKIQSASESLLNNLTSRPVPGGNWDPEAPLKWCENFGRRSAEYEEHLKTITQLTHGDEGYFDVSDMQVPGVTIVRTKEQASIVMEKLMSSDPMIFHACDTEVMDIDLKAVGPVGNGYVTCLSMYSGPDFDYGLGQGPGTTLWIDNLDDAHGMLQYFKDWFQDERFLKVWHNYGFDRHVMWNEGIDVKGFGGDTMHMARLQDTSRMKNGGGGYSLEALTAELLDIRKKPMKEIFGVPRIRKDGTPGSLVDIPSVEVLQRDPRFREKFIQYSCYDAKGTWNLHEKLIDLLKQLVWIENANMYDYYWANMRPFGEVLTDMERRGIRVDAKDYLASVETQARKDRDEHSKIFREWAAKRIGVSGLALNPASAAQLCTFLFGGATIQKTKGKTDGSRVFKVAREEIPDDALEAFRYQHQKNSANNQDQGKTE
jgi:3'-5' exonuclease